MVLGNSKLTHDLDILKSLVWYKFPYFFNIFEPDCITKFLSFSLSFKQWTYFSLKKEIRH